MTRLPSIILLLIALIAAAGCERHDTALEARVDALSALADVRPDSALRLLDSIAPEAAKAPKASRMRHALATVKAQDKAHLHPASDSAIAPLIKYYTSRPSSDTLRPLAFYYAGRVYSDLGDASEALDYFGKALDAIPDSQNLRLRSSIHAQMGDLFYKQYLLDYALNHFIQQGKYEKLSNDTIGYLHTQMSIAHIYRETDSIKSTEKILDDISRSIFSTHDTTLISTYISQYINHLISQNQYAEADSMFNAHNLLTDKSNSSSVNSILLKLDNGMERYDKVKDRANIILEGSNIYSKRMAAKYLAEIYVKENNPAKSLEYINLYRFLSDSISQIEAYAAMSKMENLYNYKTKENQILNLKNNNLNKQRTIYIIVIIGLLCLTSALIILYRNVRLNWRIEELKETSSIMLKDKDRLIQEKEQQIEMIRAELRTSKQNQQEKESELNSLISEIDIIKISSFFIESSANPKPKISHKDFSDLETTLLHIHPDFIQQLRALNLSSRDYHDALLIKINITLKGCANILGISPQGLANSRKRNFNKLSESSEDKDWTSLIRSL